MKNKKISRVLKNLQALLCILAVLAVAAAAVYLGVWVLCIGGIVQVIEGGKANPVSSYNVAVGLVKFFVAWPVGVWSFIVGCFLASRLWPSRY